SANDVYQVKVASFFAAARILSARSGASDVKTDASGARGAGAASASSAGSATSVLSASRRVNRRVVVMTPSSMEPRRRSLSRYQSRLQGRSPCTAQSRLEKSRPPVVVVQDLLRVEH